LVPRPHGPILALMILVLPGLADGASAQWQTPRAVRGPEPGKFVAPDGQSTVLLTWRNAESVVSVFEPSGKEIARLDLTSETGSNGVGVEMAGWTPNSSVFVFTGSSSGGHSPWKVPGFLFLRSRGVFVSLESALSAPIVDTKFVLNEPDVLSVTLGTGKSDRAGTTRRVRLDALPTTIPMARSRSSTGAPARYRVVGVPAGKKLNIRNTPAIPGSGDNIIDQVASDYRPLVGSGNAEGPWVEVLHNGSRGFVHKDYLEPEAGSSLPTTSSAPPTIEPTPSPTAAPVLAEPNSKTAPVGNAPPPQAH